MTTQNFEEYKISVNDRYNWQIWKPYLNDQRSARALEFLQDFPQAVRDLPVYKFQFYIDGELYGTLQGLQGNSNNPKTIAESISIASGVFVRYTHVADEESWKWVSPDRTI
jgi:hypothetical protein